MNSNAVHENSPGTESVHEFSGRKNKFSSTLSSYITQLGHSLGMSDIWKFPFLTYRNGGGAFLIPFITMMVLCGIPTYFLEFSVGKFSGRGPYQVWDICPLLKGVGITINFSYGIIFVVGSSIFRCWIMQFIFYAVRDPIPWSHCENEWNTPACERSANSSDDTLLNGSANVYAAEPNGSSVTVKEYMSAAEEFWQYKVLHLSSGISDFSSFIWRYFLFMFFLRVIVSLCNIKSIKSIEKVIWVTATIPIIMSIAIFIRSMMLPGAHLGLSYFFYPEFDKILNARVWIEATLMAFYTLSFGWGAIVLLGSHADFKENCLRTATILPVIDMSVAVFNGMVCFCVLGNMAHSNNVNITEVISAGMATGMVSYVTAVSSFPLPQLWSVLFLISMFLTGIEGQLVPFDMLMQLIGDLFPREMNDHRLKILVTLSFVLYILALPFCAGNGTYIFLWIEWYAVAWFGPIVAFLEAFVIAWLYGLDRFDEDVHMMIGRGIPWILRLGMAFVSPVIIAVIFLTSLVKYVPPKYGTYSYPIAARVLGWFFVFVTMLPIILQAFYMILKSEGPCFKVIAKLIKPVDSWGPGEVTRQAEYNALKSKYNSRTFKDLLYYNMFGKYRPSSAMNIVEEQEMDQLNDKNDHLNV